MRACGLFSQPQQENAEDVQMDGCQEAPPDSANGDELQQFMIMPRLGLNLENYFESMKY